MSADLIIRPLLTSDAESLRSLRLLGLQTDAYAFSSSYDEEIDKPLEFYENHCKSTPDKVFFGAFIENTLIGLTSIVRETHLKTQHHANIYAVYVHPDYRGQNIASMLLTACIDQAKQWQGVDWLQLGVAEGNTKAINAYLKAGFITWGTQQDTLRVGDQSYNELHMALDLRTQPN